METVYRDYKDKGVQFFYVYKSVQHPEINNFVSACSIDERLKHIAEAKRRFKTDIPWICDTMNDAVKKAFGGAPNGEFVIDPAGKIIRKRFWSNPKTLREYLVELIGPVDPVTTVVQLPAAFRLDNRKIASGVVPRIELPGRMSTLVVEPDDDGDAPFFAKLRVECQRGLLGDSKSGKMYLGLYLDPLYKVHWNNLAGKIKLEIYAADGISVSETTLNGPEVTEEADVDPRQFLVDVDRGDVSDPLTIKVSYTVCDDAETFCKDIEQSYVVSFESVDMGSRPGVFMPAMFANVRKLDKNGDGDITTDEIPPGSVSLFVGHMDYNGNETIEKSEIDTFMKMFNNGRGFDSEKNDGQGRRPRRRNRDLEESNNKN